MFKLWLLIYMLYRLTLQAYYPAETVKFDTRTAYDWIEQIQSEYVRLGMTNAVKTVHFEFASIIDAPSTWIAASDCRNKIVFNPTLFKEGNVYYSTAIPYEVLAHELAHLQQGGKCWYSDTETEQIAEIMALEVVAAQNTPISKQATYQALRDILLTSIVTEAARLNIEVDLHNFDLSETEKEFYNDMFERCVVSKEECNQKSHKYFNGVIYRIVNSSGLIYSESFPLSKANVEHIRTFLLSILPPMHTWFDGPIAE